MRIPPLRTLSYFFIGFSPVLFKTGGKFNDIMREMWWFDQSNVFTSIMSISDQSAMIQMTMFPRVFLQRETDRRTFME
ncbi:hypothetical protein VSK92_11985 [Bacillus swezeyi]|uniref:Uncharacterized protein n=1 Tax=Bacillus swezeyi TaxID=1925020 RepID=A0A5M8RWR0_9BACI|nr:hypothetical protein DX927_02385 [Bacillus swezeyi]KAA6476297.1 hypothetical protein DX928_09540 [Bacillus swezeyi]